MGDPLRDENAPTTTAEIPEEDLAHARPPTPDRRIREQRGPYGTRLSPTDRASLLEALRAGATLGAAAMLIGRNRSTIEQWRMKGRAGVPGYRALYTDMEKAMGHSIKRLHLIAQLEAKNDGRLALALLDRLDPDFRRLREQAKRPTLVDGEATAETATLNADGTVAKTATRVRYRLSWDDGSPVRFPGLGEKPALPAAREPIDGDDEPDDLERDEV